VPECRHADDVQRRYPNVRAIPDSRFVFDIKGNHYRLIVHVFFPANVVYVKWFGTHAEYDDIDPVEVDEF
jgi:mRNA interferase HigB